MVMRFATPLCPAGHLPLHRLLWVGPNHDSISPLEEEMPGRAEGGGAPAHAFATVSA